MVPVEVRAFALLSVCVMLLAGVLAFQVLSRAPSAFGLMVMLVLLAIAFLLAIVVLVTTRQVG